jgi:predicted molibdopterin-dependent oxidoreductase YjgC
MKLVKTICGYCGTGCGLVLEVADNKIVKIRGDKEAPVNKLSIYCQQIIGY